MSNPEIINPLNNLLEAKSPINIPDLVPEIFVPLEEEQAYCRENNVILERLPNKTTLVSAAFKYEDSNKSKITIRFPTGSWNDPSGKSGLHHIAEHRIANKLVILANIYGCDFNAFTSSTNVDFQFYGLANPNEKRIGVWPLLDMFFDYIDSPETIMGDFRVLIDQEKQNVRFETSRKNSNHELLVEKFIDEKVLPNSLYNIPVLGSVTDLNTLTEADVNLMINQIFVPEGMFVSVYTEEDKIAINKYLSQYLETKIRYFPHRPKILPDVPSHNDTRINPDYRSQPIYFHDTKLRNNIVTLDLLWDFNVMPFDRSVDSLSLLITNANSNLFRYAREHGLAYEFNISYSYLNDFEVLVELKINLDKNTYPEMIENSVTLIENVIGNIGQSELENILAKSKIFRNANPPGRTNRVIDLVNGLDNFGRIINFDKRIARVTCNYDDLQIWRDKILFQTPTIFVVGDLPE
jgi:predicted Zn-dependent peptidase